MEKLIAVASEGGHLIQLLRLKPLFSKFETHLVTTNKVSYSCFVGTHVINDVNIDSGIIEIFKCLFQALQIMLLIRPKVILSTGALPGLILIFLGKVFFKKTIWIDSIANSKELSSSGKYAKYIATHCLTQWPDLADNKRVKYLGSVI
jgi:UDP-N-acetylglucosamine:LPS N-acetylglucosamine transferase